jgi:cold shock CspA family protein
MLGTVKFYSKEKGFGFVSCEGGEWFFHRSKVLGPIASGDPVEFWLDDGPMRLGVPTLVAVDIRKVDDPSIVEQAVYPKAP